MTKFSQNSEKAKFWAILGRHKFSKKKWALSISRPYDPLTSCRISRKPNEQILKKVHYDQTDGRTQIHRTLLQGGSPIIMDFSKAFIVLTMTCCKQNLKNVI